MTDAASTPDRLALLEHRAWVRALARRLCADENDVDDVEQDTWTAALRTRPAEPRALRSWLGVVASRFALQRIRGETRRIRREETIAAAARDELATDDVVAEADAHGHVVQAVLALDEPYRTTVLLRYFEGLAIADVARRMDAPVETVRTRLKRAHERLRGALGPEHDRALALLVAPAGATAASAPAIASGAVAGGTFAHSTAAVAAVVAIGAGGAWMLTRTPDDATSGGVKVPVVAAAPQDGGSGGAGGGPGAGGEKGKPGEAVTRPATPAPAPAEDSPAAAPPPGAAWIAYDLADGHPLAGLSVGFDVDGAGADALVGATTDATGQIHTDRSKVLAIHDNQEWHFAKPTSGPVKDEPSLWFWRERPVTGTVASADPAKPLDPGAVRLTWFLPYSTVRATEPGRGMQWLMTHGFDPREERPMKVRVGGDGRLSGNAKALRGAMLVAEADGFTPAATPLVWNADGVCALTIALRPTLRIVGRLLDENGEAVVGESVQLNTSIVTTTDDEAARAMAMHPRGGYTFAGTAGHGVVALIEQATTDARGIFRFDAPAVGLGVVSVMRPGCVICRKEFREGATDAVGFDLRLARSDARVVVREARKPLASAGLMLNVADGGENGFSLPTDADGRMDPGWLQRGRWYRVVHGEWNVCFRWEGQTEIDLATLPKKPDDGK